MSEWFDVDSGADFLGLRYRFAQERFTDGATLSRNLDLHTDTTGTTLWLAPETLPLVTREDHRQGSGRYHRPGRKQPPRVVSCAS